MIMMVVTIAAGPAAASTAAAPRADSAGRSVSSRKHFFRPRGGGCRLRPRREVRVARGSRATATPPSAGGTEREVREDCPPLPAGGPPAAARGAALADRGRPRRGRAEGERRARTRATTRYDVSPSARREARDGEERARTLALRPASEGSFRRRDRGEIQRRPGPPRLAGDRAPRRRVGSGRRPAGRRLRRPGRPLARADRSCRLGFYPPGRRARSVKSVRSTSTATPCVAGDAVAREADRSREAAAAASAAFRAERERWAQQDPGNRNGKRPGRASRALWRRRGAGMRGLFPNGRPVGAARVGPAGIPSGTSSRRGPLFYRLSTADPPVALPPEASTG
jgi:hypothetical protein